jgi:hypothetical protein
LQNKKLLRQNQLSELCFVGGIKPAIFFIALARTEKIFAQYVVNGFLLCYNILVCFLKGY